MSDQQHPEGPAAGDAGGPAGSAMSADQAEVAAALEAAAAAPPPSADVAAGASAAVAAAAAGLSATAAAHVATLSAGAEASAAGAGGAGAAGTAGGAGAGTAGTWIAALFATAAAVALVGWFASSRLDAPEDAPTEPPLAAASPSDGTTAPTSAPSEVSPPTPGAGPAVPAPSPDATAAPSPGPVDPPPDPDTTVVQPPVGPVPPGDPAASPAPAIAAPSAAPGPASETAEPTSPPSARRSPPPVPTPAPTAPTATPEPTTTPSPEPPGTVLRRVNAGGPTLPGHGGPNWQTDRPRTSPWRPESPDLSERHTHSGKVRVDPSLGDEVPVDLFDTDRTHPGPTSPWEWEFDVPVDEPVLVRVYLAERSPDVGPGDHVLGLVVEDQPVDPALDLVVDPGRDVGTVREVVVTGGDLADGVLDVDFVRVTGDPVVSGIEVLSLDAAQSTSPRHAAPSGATPGRRSGR